MKGIIFIYCLFLSVNAFAQKNNVIAGVLPGKALFVVDGIPVSNESMKNINPANVDKITVLKGKAAIALYGEKAANGVILVTTKNYKAMPGLSKFEKLEHALSMLPDSLRPLITVDEAIYKGDLKAIDTAKIADINFVDRSWAKIIYGNAGAHGVVDIKIISHTVVDTLKSNR